MLPITSRVIINKAIPSWTGLIPVSLQVGLLVMRSHTEETLMSLSGGTRPADRNHGNNVMHSGATK